MRRLSLWIVASALLATPAWGGIGDILVSANPCGPKPLKGGGFLAVLDVSGGGCSGTKPAVETAITCTLRAGKPKHDPEDIAVEFYSEVDGSSITGGPVCAAAGLAPGSTVTMVTGTLPSPSPYDGAVVIPAPGGSCGAGCFLHGSARVFTTGGLLTCTATRVDLSEVCFGGKPVPAATKNLTVLKPIVVRGIGSIPVVQRGD
jgi:hypothetical protein